MNYHFLNNLYVLLREAGFRSLSINRFPLHRQVGHRPTLAHGNPLKLEFTLRHWVEQKFPRRKCYNQPELYYTTTWSKYKNSNHTSVLLNRENIQSFLIYTNLCTKKKILKIIVREHMMKVIICSSRCRTLT